MWRICKSGIEGNNKITKIRRATTKGYNPRRNGLGEWVNGTKIALLRKDTIVPTEGETILSFCLMTYSMVPHSPIGESLLSSRGHGSRVSIQERSISMVQHGQVCG